MKTEEREQFKTKTVTIKCKSGVVSLPLYLIALAAGYAELDIEHVELIEQYLDETYTIIIDGRK